MSARVCTAKGCSAPRHGRGLCRKHYQRLMKTGSTAPPVGSTLRGRLLSNLVVDLNAPRLIDNSACWLWTRYRDEDGYGHIARNGRAPGVHIVAWELFRGPVPDGLELDHLCRVRHCANPDHLEPVTRAENVGRTPLHAFALANAAKDKCDSGHEFTEANTYTKRNGSRECRACRRGWAARYKARKAVS